MCEFLVRVVDKVNPDPYKDARCLKRGDVVVVMPNGHAWTALELGNPDWRIFSCPAMSVEEGEAFLAQEPGTSPTAQKRFFKMDFDTFSPSKRDEINANPRSGYIMLSLVEARNAKAQKPSIPDPFVIGAGSSMEVIG